MLPILAGGAVIVLMLLMARQLFSAAARKGDPNRLPDVEELGAEGRKLLRPLKQDREAILKLLDQNRDKPHIQALGKEVLSDVDALMAQAGRLALKANSLKKLMKGQAKAEQALKDSKDRLKEASSEAERSAYQDAILARESELESYGRVQAARSKLEAAIFQAHARVSEIKSLLLASAVQSNLQSDEALELRQRVDRLQSMRVSLDEAEALLQDT